GTYKALVGRNWRARTSCYTAIVPSSGKKRFDDLAVDVGQAEVAACVVVGEPDKEQTLGRICKTIAFQTARNNLCGHLKLLGDPACDLVNANVSEFCEIQTTF